MILHGHVKDNRILLDGDIQLPDGLSVEIIVPDDSNECGSGLCGIWFDDRPPQEIVDEILESRTAGRDLTL